MGIKERIMSIKNDKSDKERWWTRKGQQQHSFNYVHEPPTPQAELNRTTSLSSGKETPFLSCVQRPPGHNRDHMWLQLALCFPKPRRLRHT